MPLAAEHSDYGVDHPLVRKDGAGYLVLRGLEPQHDVAVPNAKPMHARLSVEEGADLSAVHHPLMPILRALDGEVVFPVDAVVEEEVPLQGKAVAVGQGDNDALAGDGGELPKASVGVVRVLKYLKSYDAIEVFSDIEIKDVANVADVRAGEKIAARVVDVRSEVLTQLSAATANVEQGRDAALVYESRGFCETDDLTSLVTKSRKRRRPPMSTHTKVKATIKPQIAPIHPQKLMGKSTAQANLLNNKTESLGLA